MTSRGSLAGAVLLLLAGSGPSPTASGAVAEVLCQGRPATIVGTPDQNLIGTGGPDVVVTNGASDTETGAGDDLVCVTSGPGGPSVDGSFVSVGAGDDVVDTSDADASVVGVVLGAGADTFLGGPGPDIVDAGRWWKDEDGFGPDHDVVSTGGGADRVTTGATRPYPDADPIDLGPGADTLTVFGNTSDEGSTTGGTGRDTIEIERATRSGEWQFNNRAGAAYVDGSPVMRWTGVEAFQVGRLPVDSSVRFSGGGGDERLKVHGSPTVAVMAGGDDLVDVEAGPRMLAGGLWVDGGNGEDRLRIDLAPTDTLNLTTGLLRFGEATGNPRQTRALRLEAADVLVSGALRLVGTSGPNRLRYAACPGTVVAKGGDDTVEFRAVPDGGCVDPGVMLVRGGAGDDTLVGGRHDDRPVGDTGQDTADGRGGHDVCVAERTRRCEA